MTDLDVKATAAALKALPFIGEVEFDALLGQLKTSLKGKGQVDQAVLHAALKEMGVEKEIEEPAKEQEEGDDGADGDDAEAKEGGEGDGEEAAEPAPKVPKFTNHAADLLNVLSGGKRSMDASNLLATLQICTAGWGEASLRNIISAHDLAGKGGLSEPELFSALMWAAPKSLELQQRTHLRKIWRDAERWQPEEKEEEEGGEEGEDESESKTESKTEESGPEPVRVVADDFIEKLKEDEYLSAAFCEDVPVPADPAEGDGEEED